MRLKTPQSNPTQPKIRQAFAVDHRESATTISPRDEAQPTIVFATNHHRNRPLPPRPTTVKSTNTTTSDRYRPTDRSINQIILLTKTSPSAIRYRPLVTNQSLPTNRQGQTFEPSFPFPPFHPIGPPRRQHISGPPSLPPPFPSLAFPFPSVY